jgi:hypothetical protein
MHVHACVHKEAYFVNVVVLWLCKLIKTEIVSSDYLLQDYLFYGTVILELELKKQVAIN